MRALLLAVAMGSACVEEDTLPGVETDGSFGMEAPSPLRDAGMDGATITADAAPGGESGRVRVRFLHGLVNLGRLTVCHDPDGPDGPLAASVLANQDVPLGADFGVRSQLLDLPALSTGSLTLQREGSAPSGSDAGLDGGIVVVVSDAGAPVDPCALSTREATIPLPIRREWLEPRTWLPAEERLPEERLSDLELPAELRGSPSVTLLGSGFSLSPQAVERRAAEQAAAWLTQHPSDMQGAERAASQRRSELEASFAPRALVHRDRAPEDPQRFSLSVFHAIPDVPARGARAEREVGAVRLCIQAGTRTSGSALPPAPTPGIPFRLRTRLNGPFEPNVSYVIQVFPADAFDDEGKGCSNTSMMALASATFSGFKPDRAYTLALVGAVRPSALCSAGDASIARGGCPRAADDLKARIERLED